MPATDISIIIPTYNRLWCLPEAIESCRNAKCSVEIIVVDDGSTDGTWEWLQQQKDIVILRQMNMGKCWAVNKAFGIAKGKYIRFLDSDDSLTGGANDEQYKLAEKNSSDIVVSGYILIDENKQVLKQQPWIECDDFIAQQLGECDSSHYSAYLFRKSFIEDIPHRPDYAYRDDRLFVLEAALKHPKVAIHKGFALLHTQHKKPRLQQSRGMQQTAQHFQHLNIYKTILAQLQQNGELTRRRIKASINTLWPLCQWIARENIQEAGHLLEWIRELSPDFKIPEKGILGLLYKNAGADNTHKILQLLRFFRIRRRGKLKKTESPKPVFQTDAAVNLSENSPLDRYLWTSKKIDEIKYKHLATGNVTVFDIGSRDNILKNYISSPAILYRAFDLEPLDQSAEKWDIEKPFPYNYPSPQIVTMLEIVEHLKNPWICLKNIYNTIMPGGYLVLTTPNPGWSNSRLDVLKSGYLSCFTPTDLELNHHVFTPWPHIVERLLTDSGFEIVEFTTLEGKTNIFDKNLRGFGIPLKLASRLIKKIIESRDAAACGMSYGIIAKRIG